jgi:CBS-domain-containing membrane protein
VSTLSTTGVVSKTVAVSLAGIATLTITGLKGPSGTIALVATATLTTAGGATATATLILVATSTLGITAVVVALATGHGGTIYRGQQDRTAWAWPQNQEVAVFTAPQQMQGASWATSDDRSVRKQDNDREVAK